jgi:hypothetical protein
MITQVFADRSERDNDRSISAFACAGPQVRIDIDHASRVSAPDCIDNLLVE